MTRLYQRWFGLLIEAALRNVSRIRVAKNDLDIARHNPPPRTDPAPKYGTAPPPGSIRAGALQREQEQRRRITSGAPPGYRAMTGRIPTGVVAKARTLLHHDYGTEIPFELDGKRYLARLERHYHPPGYVGGPTGWHKGVTVYEED
jgi:hypothetical protein